MTAVTRAEVIALCPKLERLDDLIWPALLAYANDLDACALGVDECHPTLKWARLNLGAHYGLVSMQARSGAAGPVTAEAAGAVRRSYGLQSSTAGNAGFNLTQYGQTYLSIINATLASLPFLV